MVFKSYHLSDEAFIIKKKVHGDKSIKLLKKQENMESSNCSYPINIPVALELAEGSIIKDVEGNQYIDFFAGCGVLNVGHNNKDILIFSFENFNGALPDIITMSKGLRGIGMPIDITIFKKELNSLSKCIHSGSFRGNQLRIAAALSAIKFSRRHNLTKYVKALGREMLNYLPSIQKKSKFIGDVRGIGMIFGIEYVKDKKEKNHVLKLLLKYASIVMRTALWLKSAVTIPISFDFCLP